MAVAEAADTGSDMASGKAGGVVASMDRASRLRGDGRARVERMCMLELRRYDGHFWTNARGTALNAAKLTENPHWRSVWCPWLA
jgi:hypothetical protein